MKEAKKRFPFGKVITFAVLISYLLPILYLIFRVIYPNASLPRVPADYLMMLLQCVIGILTWFIPSILTHRFKLEIPSFMSLAFILFMYCALFLGEIRLFYYDVPHWDTFLHTLSGVMIGTLGFSFVNILNFEKNTYLRLSPFFVAFFAFCFAVALGTIWEIFEFSADGLLATNMQKFRLEDGTELVGRAALRDTMKDLIVDILGALAATAVGYLSLKKKDGWIEKAFLRFREETAAPLEPKHHKNDREIPAEEDSAQETPAGEVEHDGSV